MWGILFGEFQCLPVDDCSAVSCDSGALARGSESKSFYSAILHQSVGLLLNGHLSSGAEVEAQKPIGGLLSSPQESWREQNRFWIIEEK